MDGFDPGLSGGGGCFCEMEGRVDGESCSMWSDHDCRGHMSDDNNKQFLVVASGDFRHTMRIPQEVGCHLRNMTRESKRVVLEAPDGRTYPVGVSLEVGEVVLRSGWHDFVNGNHIQEDYSIRFVYRGDSIFKVHISDSSGHDKSSSCFQAPSGIFGAVPPCAPPDRHLLNEQQAVPDPGHVYTSNDIVYTMLPGCLLTVTQDKKVLEIADTIKSEIPLHVAAMNNKNVVYIPLQLVLNHFKDKETKATIELKAPDNNIHIVGASKDTDYLVVLDSGWDTFVASQRIQEKDILIFGSTEISRLKVVILDPSGHEKTSSCSVMEISSSTEESSGDSVDIVEPPPHAVLELSSSDDDDIVKEGTRKRGRPAKSQKMASTPAPSKKSGSGACKPHDRASVKVEVSSEPLSYNLGVPYQRPYLLSKFATLSLQAEKKVEEKVQAIGSQLPIFVKVLSSNNVDGIGCNTCEMGFCMEYGSACLPDKKQTLLLQLEGKGMLWETTFDVHKYSKMRRIYKGWKEFSRQNALEVGDICLFKPEDTDTSILKMTVYLIRKTQIEL